MAMIIVSMVLVIVVMTTVAAAAWSVTGACIALLVAQLAGLITAWVCLTVCFLVKLTAYRRSERHKECMRGPTEN